ncbi:MAG TPA: DNA repair and recombination protein RadA [archaeon]|nr:DNA repair and recombination protein RadA [archaeon]
MPRAKEKEIAKEIEEPKESKEEETAVSVEDELRKIPGVGDKTLQKMRESGYDNLMSIAATLTADLVAASGLGDETAAKIINAARSKLKMGFEPASEVLKKRERIAKITTGSKTLDNLLGGGVETQAILEAYGAFGSGKSQIAHQLAVNVQLPKERGGLEAKAIFIDSEQTFRPERIVDMAKALDLDPHKALDNVFVARSYNSDHQILLAEKAEEVLKKENVKLIIVDSLTASFRSDYTGRGMLANRQQKLNRHMHHLQRLADIYNVAIYVTNQVMANPAIMFGDPTAPIGGHIVGHQATYRVYLRRSKESKRIAKLIDSPWLPEGETVFSVGKDGIRDIED